jgi:hypothetical protein
MFASQQMNRHASKTNVSLIRQHFLSKRKKRSKRRKPVVSCAFPGKVRVMKLQVNAA